MEFDEVLHALAKSDVWQHSGTMELGLNLSPFDAHSIHGMDGSW